MTLEELKAMDREFITPAIAASIIGCDPNGIRFAAHHEPDGLNFPTSIIKTRVKIPRRPFIRYVESGEPWFSRHRAQKLEEKRW